MAAPSAASGTGGLLSPGHSPEVLPTQTVRIHVPIIAHTYQPPVPITVTFQYGLNGYTGVHDATISNYGDSGVNYGIDPGLWLRWQRSSLTSVRSALLRFDVSSIPSQATVLQARLYLYATVNTNPAELDALIFRVLRPWQEMETTWLQAQAGTPWAAPGANGAGADRAVQPTDRITLTTRFTWVSADVTSLTQYWVSNPGQNYGLLLQPTGTGDSANVQYTIASSQYPDPTLRPILEVTYIVLPGGGATATPTVPSATSTPTVTSTPSEPTATATPSATATPPPSWWHIGYQYRRRLTVQAAPEAPVQAGYSVSLTLNTDDLVTAGKLRLDRRDWRIVAWNGLGWAEIDRDVRAPAETWFRLVAPIPAGQSSQDYYVYYGNPSETVEPRASRDGVYAFYDDFDAYDIAKWPVPQPPFVDVANGVITVTAQNPTGPGDSWITSQPRFSLGHQVEIRARHPDYVYQQNRDADHGFSDDGHTNEAKLRSWNAQRFQRVNRVGDVSNSTIVQYGTKPADTDWHIFRITRLDAEHILFEIDAEGVETSTTNIPLMDLPVHIRAYHLEPGDQARNVVDWIRVRMIVTPEPVVVTGPEEHATFTTP